MIFLKKKHVPPCQSSAHAPGQGPEKKIEKKKNFRLLAYTNYFVEGIHKIFIFFWFIFWWMYRCLYTDIYIHRTPDIGICIPISDTWTDIYDMYIYIYIVYRYVYIYIYIVYTICIYIGICIPVYIHAYIDKYIYRYIRYVYIYTYRIPVYRYRYIYTYRIRYRLLYVNIVYKFGLHSDECIGVCIPIYIHIVHGYRLFYINIIYKFE